MVFFPPQIYILRYSTRSGLDLLIYLYRTNISMRSCQKYVIHSLSPQVCLIRLLHASWNSKTSNSLTTVRLCCRCVSKLSSPLIRVGKAIACNEVDFIVLTESCWPIPSLGVLDTGLTYLIWRQKSPLSHWLDPLLDLPGVTGKDNSELTEIFDYP